MAWCPKCRNEYVDGITICADCGIPLVDELPAQAGLEGMEQPAVLCQVGSEEDGVKFVTYLACSGIATAGIMMSGENGEDGYDVVVAEFERGDAEEILSGLVSPGHPDPADYSELLPDIEMKLSEIQEEQANQMFSDLRTEQSTVYVKKKDKYNDLKFSGISFIIFGVLGAGLLALNLAGVLHIFNSFSSVIMLCVFVLFIGIGITSLSRAKKMKSIVSEEDKVTDEVQDWIGEHITSGHIAALMDDSLSEEDNYFHVHGILCAELQAQFQYLDQGYVDQLMDDRYNAYCEEQA